MNTEELVNIEEKNKESEIEANIKKIEEDKIRARKNKLKKKREGRTAYEVEIDFISRIEAEDFLNFLTNELFLDAHLLENDDIITIIIKNVTDADLSKIKRRKSLSAAEKSISEAADKIAEGAIETVAFAAEKVVVPTTKATVKAALGITKGLVKTTAQVGASLISSTADSAKQMAEELKEDEDIIAIKKLFKRNKQDAKKKEGIRIKG